jgi:hypothetical protein
MCANISFRLQKFVAGLRYPVGKAQLLARARQLGADEAVMSALMLLPDKPYESPVALSVEIGRQLVRRRKLQ